MEQGSLLGHTNGGLSRVNLPQEGIIRTNLTPGAMHRVYINTPVTLPSTYVASLGGAGEFSCVWYTDYRGEWIEQTYTLTDVLEGVLHIEFSCWEWHNSYRTLESPKRTRYRVAVDGLVGAESAEQWSQWANPFLSFAVPHPGGTATITVGALYSPSKGDPAVALDDPAADQMMFAGGTLLVVGRHR